MKRVPKSVQLALKIVVLGNESIDDFRKRRVVNVVLAGLAIGGIQFIFLRRAEHDKGEGEAKDT